MDSYREHPSDFELGTSAEADHAHDVAAAIGTDERRMHVRAYNYWVSLLEGRDFPSIEDLEPEDLNDFAAHSVLLDFTCGRDNPAVPYIGAAIREECGLNEDTRTIADVPSRSLLSRLTDHYLQIIANRAPIGFEAEFANQRDETICYRGILMPFSSDGDTIDFIYGVINWKHVAVTQSPRAEEPVTSTDATSLDGDYEQPAQDYIEAEVAVADEPLELDQPLETPVAPHQPVPHFSWEDGPLSDAGSDDDELRPIEIDADAGLADRLWAARETAEAVKAGEGRTRSALYRALSLAYDFALAARADPDDYAELLEESGLKAQERAPMTPIVKLVFGIDYDKARLTEFAAALSYGMRQDVEQGGFQSLIEQQAGGLKALVAAERQARRPEPKADTKSEAARARLRSAPPITLAQVPSDEEFAVVVTRRGQDGKHELVAIVEDEALVERAIRRAA
ncbi:MAG TPA: hypothetical protein VIL42_07325 [Sphingomicrobium sp.]|jgi:hypothetical protein